MAKFAIPGTVEAFQVPQKTKTIQISKQFMQENITYEDIGRAARVKAREANPENHYVLH